MFCVNCGSQLQEGVRFCGNCGHLVMNQNGMLNNGNIQYGSNAPYRVESVNGGNIPYVMNNMGKKHLGVFSVARLVLGIITMVLFCGVLVESSEVDDFYTLIGSDETAGTMGILFSLLFLAAGIVGVCTRNSRSDKGAYTAAGLYWGATLTTIGTGDAYPDLPIYGIIALAFGVVFFVAGVKTMKNQ